MLKAEIKQGGKYKGKVNGRVVTVLVDSIVVNRLGKTIYYVTNLDTGRKTLFRSAAKFRESAA